MDIQTDVTLMPKDKPETPLSSPLSFVEQGILLFESECLERSLQDSLQQQLTMAPVRHVRTLKLSILCIPDLFSYKQRNLVPLLKSNPI